MAAASRVLIHLVDGSGRGHAGLYLVYVRAAGFFLCQHGAATADGAVRHDIVDNSDDDCAAVLPTVSAWSNFLFLRKLA